MKSLKTIKAQHIIFFISLLMLISALSFYLIFKNSFSLSENNLSESDSSSPNHSQQTPIAPTPTPKPLPTGKQVSRFSHGPLVKGPKPTIATIDPIDPNIGDVQKISIEIDHDLPVSKATAILITDNQKIEYPLTLIEGDRNKGTWSVEWKMEDSYNYTYQINIVIHDAIEIYNGGIALR